MSLPLAKLLLCAGLTVLAVGSYVIWPSRWNIWAHLQLCFALIAYVIPIYGAGVLDSAEPQLVRIYLLLTLAGAAAYVLGLLVGDRGRSLVHLPLPISYQRFTPEGFQHYVLRRAAILAVAGIAGMALSFFIMGFVPAFARFPFMAKYFRGVYAAPYQRIEILYRASYYVLITIIPIVFSAWLVRRRIAWATLTVVSVAMIAVTLNRGLLGTDLLIVVGLVAARRRSWTWLFVALLAAAYVFGASLNQWIGLRHEFISIWKTVAAGTPDITDQLNFLFHFLPLHQFTYGKTFVGGLVPGRYIWSPSVYSLSVISNFSVGINKLYSGGLRMTAPIWGYTAFGWAGALAVPFLSGLIQARCIKFARPAIEGRPLLQAAVALLVYINIGVPLSQFYVLSYYLLPTGAVCLVLLYVSFVTRHEAAYLTLDHHLHPGAAPGAVAGLQWQDSRG